MQKYSLLSTQIILKGEEQPLVCPVCNFVLKDGEDVRSVKKEKACSECTINFKHIHLKEWKQGWRPSIDEARSKMHI